MGQGDVPPKGLRKYNRLKKAGLVERHGKLVRVDNAFQQAKSDNDKSRTRAEEKVRNAVDQKQEMEKKINTKLNKEIIAFYSAVILKSHSEFFEFVEQNKPILIHILKNEGLLHASGDESVLTRDTFNRLNSLLKSYSLVFNGNDIISWKGKAN